MPFVQASQDGRPRPVFWARKFGYNLGIGSSEESIWVPGGSYPWSTWDAGPTNNLTIKSASSSDAPGQAGIQTVRITGLGGDGSDKDVDVTLSGTNTVSVPGTWSMVHRIGGLSAGTSNSAVGNISAYYNDATEVARLPAGDGSTQQCVFTIPLGYKGHVHRIFVNIAAGDTAVFWIKVRRASTGVWSRAQRFSISGGTVVIFQEGDNEPTFELNAGDDVEISAQSNNAGGSAGVASVVCKLYQEF